MKEGRAFHNDVCLLERGVQVATDNNIGLSEERLGCDCILCT